MDPRFGEMLDTPSEARAKYYALVAQMTPEQRARKVAGLARAARELARAGIRRDRPEATPHEVEVELIARLYGEGVARRLAGHLAADRG